MSVKSESPLYYFNAQDDFNSAEKQNARAFYDTVRISGFLDTGFFFLALRKLLSEDFLFKSFCLQKNIFIGVVY